MFSIYIFIRTRAVFFEKSTYNVDILLRKIPIFSIVTMIFVNQDKNDFRTSVRNNYSKMKNP